MPKTNEAENEVWIGSWHRHLRDLALITPTGIGLSAIVLVACGALKLEDSSAPVTSLVERSLYPGHRFLMRKLGDPHRQTRVAMLCRKAMIDEAPQLLAVAGGHMALIGPRADTPQHVTRTFSILQANYPSLHNRTLAAHTAQKAGIISSYAIYSHAHNLGGLSEEERFSGEELLVPNAFQRGNLDSQDFEQASPGYEGALLLDAYRMVRDNYAHYVRASRNPISA